MKPLLLTLLTCAFTAVIAFAEAKPKDEKEAPAPEKVAAMPDLTGTSWTLKSWSDKELVPSKNVITAIFIMRDGKSCFHGNGGTNRYTAEYEVNADGGFSVGNTISTMRAPNNGEHIYHPLLQQVRKYSIDGKKLVLSDKDGKELLVFEKTAEPVEK